MITEQDWSSLLTEYRVLGGTAENIRIGHGSLGRGLFAIDPSRPVELHTPPNLLLRRRDLIFADDRFRIAPDASIGAAERAWLERYLNEFSWGNGGREETAAEIERMRSLPLPVRETLARICGMKYCVGELSPAIVAERFFESRVITIDEEMVMPMIELVNNGIAPGYDTSAGVAVRGLFPDEVLVGYSDMHDSLLCFATWGIVCERPFAYSHPLRTPTAQMEIEISIDIHEGHIVEVRTPRPLPLTIPSATMRNGRLHLSFLILGMKGFPRLPKGMFRRAMNDARVTLDDEVFEVVQHLNRGTFLGMLRELEGVAGDAAGSLRRVCLMQLEALNHTFGSRPL
jgi:hypothetical protein